MTHNQTTSQQNVFELLGDALAEVHRAKNPEKKKMDDEARRAAPGSFIRLSRGTVHYELSGPADGDIVVLLPGATLPMWVWERVTPALAKEGFRTLRFDYYGRGYSDRPADDNTPESFNSQINELTDALGLGGKLHLVGLALGGLVSVLYALEHRERVASLSLIAPDGMGTKLAPVFNLLLIPGIGEYIFDLIGADALLHRMPDYSPNAELVNELAQRISQEFQYQGYKRAVLACIRNMPLHTAEPHFRAVGGLGIRTLLMWGKKDRTTPVSIAAGVRDALGQSEYVEFDAGHMPQYETPDVFNLVLARFLRDAQSGS